jgi:hypothetical protein
VSFEHARRGPDHQNEVRTARKVGKKMRIILNITMKHLLRGKMEKMRNILISRWISAAKKIGNYHQFFPIPNKERQHIH